MASARKDRALPGPAKDGGGTSAPLPALIGSAPAAPALADRLDATPEDETEAFAFALWNAGRKAEAVEFLQRQRARYRADALPLDGDLPHEPGPHEPGEAPRAADRKPAAPDPSDAWAGPTVSLAPNISVPPRDGHMGDIPAPPIPRRPLVLAAALVALAAIFVWPGAERLAALPRSLPPSLTSWLGLTPAPDAVADTAPASDAPATTGATTPVEVVAAEPQATPDADIPPVRVIEEAQPEETAAADPLLRSPSPASQAAVDIPPPAGAAAPADATTPDSRTAAASTDADMAPEDAEASDVALAEVPPPAADEGVPPAEDMADAEEPVTLQSLAGAVEAGPRLPRVRPEPSPETIAAVTAPEPSARYAPASVAPARAAPYPAAPYPAAQSPAAPTVLAESEEPYVVEEPGPYASGQYQPAPPPYGQGAASGPRTFEIIGRVEDRPHLAWRRAMAERYAAARRAWAKRHAAQPEPAPYVAPYSGPYGPPPSAPYPYQSPYPPQPQNPWAQQTWNGTVPGY